jgi:tetratricopeptide (TPR) repeat protein
MPNSKEFPPKVIDLFTEAKALCAQSQCNKTCGQIEPLIAKGDFNAAQGLLNSDSQCPCAANARTALANARYKKGQDLYASGRFAEAAAEFAAVQALDGTHELAGEYLKLSQQRLDLSLQQAFSDWRISFESRQFDRAADFYDKIRSNAGPAATQLAAQIEGEYRRILSGLVASWKVACSNADAARMDALRREVSATAPRSELSASTLAEMEQCTHKACMLSEPALAINRLTTRVNPVIDPNLQRYITRGIRVAIQIDVDGRVTVRQITNANARVAEALKSAVEQWRFYPAIVENQPRCVDTELPITLIQP